METARGERAQMHAPIATRQVAAFANQSIEGRLLERFTTSRVCDRVSSWATSAKTIQPTRSRG